MYSNDYLLKNGITDIEELVGKSVYFLFPVKGIVKHNIRRVQYEKEWLLCVSETYKVSELGKSIFFTKEESERYQLQQLDKYSNEQRKRIIKQKIEERNKELKELNRLLKKYPIPESRFPINNLAVCVLILMKWILLFTYVQFAKNKICLIMIWIK